MSKIWRTPIFRILSLAALQLLGVAAQTTNAVCLPYFDWLFNSQHQSPCVVGSSLMAVCHGGSFNVESLPSGDHYLGPSSVLNATLCECNTVAYTLMSACAACQGRSYLSWSEWTANCPSVSAGFQEPLPTGLHVPGWAYLDPRVSVAAMFQILTNERAGCRVKPSNTFDIIQAQKNVNLTESVVPPVPASTSNPVKSMSTSTSSLRHTSTSEGSTATHVNPASASSLTNTNLNPSNNRTKMIVGVVVGAFVAGLTVLGVIAWLIRSRMAEKEDKVQIVPPVEVKIPSATYDDFKNSPRVVIEDYDKDPSCRQNV